MKLIGAAASFALFCVATIAAQDQTTIKSKIDVEGGKTRTVTGCLTPVVAGTSFMLAQAPDKNGPRPAYMLVHDRFKELAKHSGHLVQVTGKVTDRGGDAKLTVKTKTKTKVEEGADQKTRKKSEVSGDALGMPYLEVESIKTIAASCP